MTAAPQGSFASGARLEPDEVAALLGSQREMEERLLRGLDMLATLPAGMVDLRWYAIARTHFEQGFMALNRAVFQPGRVALPEDAV